LFYIFISSSSEFQKNYFIILLNPIQSLKISY